MIIKEISNHKGYYVSEDGKILKELKPWKTNSNYDHVKIQGKHYDVHRLVALHFLEHNDGVVNHKDSNKENNHYTNLEFITQKENIQHYLKNGGSAVKNFKECILLIDDKEHGRYKSIMDASHEAERLGASGSMIRKHLEHKNMKIVCDNGIV